MRIAIYDDERIVLESLARSLTGLGVEVVLAAGDWRSFLVGLRTASASVAVLDLPVERPLDWAAEAIRGVRVLGSTTRVLLVSPRYERELVTLAYQEGVAGFLVKPSLGLEELVQACQAVGEGQRFFPMAAFENLLEVPQVRDPAIGGLSQLTPREIEVLKQVGAGHDNLTIAAVLQIGERTVKGYVRALYQKLSLENRVQLALFAREAAAMCVPGSPLAKNADA